MMYKRAPTVEPLNKTLTVLPNESYRATPCHNAVYIMLYKMMLTLI